MPTRRRFRGGGGVRSAFTIEGAGHKSDNGTISGAPKTDAMKHPAPGSHTDKHAGLLASAGAHSAKRQGDMAGPTKGGGIGMAMLPFGMVALDRWAAKKGKRRTKGKKSRGRRRMRGGACNGPLPCQGGGRRRTRRRTRRRHRRTRHHRRRRR